MSGYGCLQASQAANCRPFLKSIASLTVATTALAMMGPMPSMCINREADSLAPEGLTVLRANREEFPIEATISPFESAGQRYYTIILRDINDRRRTEAQLIRLQWERAYLQDEVKSAYNFEDIVGQAPVMKRLFASIEQVAPSGSVLILLDQVVFAQANS
jgi:transcriptional regulator with GAF, ATPase, and Fis domain